MISGTDNAPPYWITPDFTESCESWPLYHLDSPSLFNEFQPLVRQIERCDNASVRPAAPWKTHEFETGWTMMD